MNLFSAIVLGIIQGITEFLPISSSAHLAFAQALIPNFSQPGVLFDVILHAGTLLAVVIYFRKKLADLILHPIKNMQFIFLLVIGTIPAVFLGYLFADTLEASFGDTRAVAIQLIVTGLFIYFIDKAQEKRKNITAFDSLIIGIAQAVAIIPGISRSGATIFAGVFLGVNKKSVADFSFLLSIPAIFGAIVLQVAKYGFDESVDFGLYTAGFIVAAIFGFLSIGILLNFLKSRNFKVFAYYCWVVGVIVLVLLA